jgi:starch synthase
MLTSRRIYGSADMVIPRATSRAVIQMIGMRWVCSGRTGHRRPATRFSDYSPVRAPVSPSTSPPAVLAEALRRAMNLFGAPRGWRPLQRRGARRNFAWDKSARQYAAVYRRALRTLASQR